jgi:hypothetical protein
MAFKSSRLIRQSAGKTIVRNKITFPIILCAGFVLLLVWWFRPQPESSVALLAVPVSKPAVQAATSSETPLPVLPAPTNPPAVSVEGVGAPPNNDEVDNRISNLQALAMNNDADSLEFILQSLTDSNPQIRAAAVEATIQFDSPDAIPSLQDALAKTESPQEKVSVQEAIDFLRLQSISQNNLSSR